MAQKEPPMVAQVAGVLAVAAATLLGASAAPV